MRKLQLAGIKNSKMIVSLQRCKQMFIGLKDIINLGIDINAIMFLMTDSVKLMGMAIDSMSTSTSMYNQSAKSFRLSQSSFKNGFKRCIPKYFMPHNSFTQSNIGYFELVLMLGGKSSNSKITRLHKRAQRALFDDYGSTFKGFL